MLEQIKSKLMEIEPKVFYGVGRYADGDSWDCIVFGRRRRKNAGSSCIQIWFLAIIKEEFIPEGMEEKVIEKMRELGLKRTDSEEEYGYFEKSGECTVEICTMEFYKSKKGC